MNKFDPDRLRIAREISCYSQASPALSVGLTRGAIALYESGKNVPSANILARLARSLGQPFDYFFVDGEQSTTQMASGEAQE